MPSIARAHALRIAPARVAATTVALLALTLFAGRAAAQSPTPAPTPAPPVTTVPQFPSTPHYLRALAGAVEDTWYVYGGGFTPRTSWVLVEALCPSLPCGPFGASTAASVMEDGTLSFYVQLPHAADPSRDRLLVALQQPLAGGDIPADALAIHVAGHNPGPEGSDEAGVLAAAGYPRGTRTGVAPVDEVIALSEALDTSAMRARLVLKDVTTTTGEQVHGFATWQCQPYILSEQSLDQLFEYPASRVYAVFRVPADSSLPLRYQGAAYGIAWYDGGTGMPLGGLTLVSADGKVVGTEVRCGTTPGYHVHDFTDFILAPYDAPAPHPAAPGPPDTGAGIRAETGPRAATALLATALALTAAGALGVVALRRARPSSEEGPQ